MDSAHLPDLPQGLARVLRLGDRLLPAALAVIPMGYFALMVIGLARSYSPVPYWDMWDGYLANYIYHQDSGWHALFLQANEHRVWFANALFYLDIAFFGGRSLLLIFVNVLLVISIWVILALIARRLLRDRSDLWPVVALGLAPLCFSWLQEQNLSWGFQSVFFVAYLFPLAAFSALAVSMTAGRGGPWFATAIFFGLASLGTMANGLLTLPLLVAMLLVVPNPSWRRAAVVTLIGAVAIAAWFQGYYFIARDRADLSQITTFILTFFGHPVAAMFRGNLGISQLAGGFFIAAALGFAGRWLVTRRTADPMTLALVTFLGYVGASCAVISVARAAIEPNVAVITRYATPPLIAWAVLLLLLAHTFRHMRFARAVHVLFVAGVAYGLLPAQRMVYSDLGPELVHWKAAAALALKMRVADREGIGQIYPTADDTMYAHVRNIARQADERRLSIMADEGLASAVASLGKDVGAEFRPCAGIIHEPEVIAGEENFRRVKGWIFDDELIATAPFAYIAKDNVIEGVVATGRVRRDPEKLADARANRGGFAGYIRASAVTPAGGLGIVCARR